MGADRGEVTKLASGRRTAYALINWSSTPIFLAMILAPRARLTRWLVGRAAMLFVALGLTYDALLASGLAGKFRPGWQVDGRSLIAAVLGGLLLGYGARLAYGCNIGAYFSGISSSSLHGWVWLAAAFAGSVLGTYLRPLFGLSVERSLKRVQAAARTRTSGRRRGALIVRTGW